MVAFVSQSILPSSLPLASRSSRRHPRQTALFVTPSRHQTSSRPIFLTKIRSHTLETTSCLSLPSFSRQTSLPATVRGFLSTSDPPTSRVLAIFPQERHPSVQREPSLRLLLAVPSSNPLLRAIDPVLFLRPLLAAILDPFRPTSKLPLITLPAP